MQLEEVPISMPSGSQSGAKERSVKRSRDSLTTSTPDHVGKQEAAYGNLCFICLSVCVACVCVCTCVVYFRV